MKETVLKDDAPIVPSDMLLGPEPGATTPRSHVEDLEEEEAEEKEKKEEKDKP